MISLALKNSQTITAAWLSNMKKEMIERECQGLLEFVESPFTLENIAGHDAVKVWLREDARLLQRGILYARRPALHRHGQDFPGAVLGRRTRNPLRRLQEFS